MTELDKAYEEMGKMNEKLYKPVIRKIYGAVMKTKFKYSHIDFIGESFCGELKSRDLSIKDFNETMVGYNKIEDGFKKLDWFKDHIPEYKVYIWFAFREGLYVWELNQTNYEANGGDNQKRIGGTSNRGYDDFKQHYYIKTDNLVKIDDTPVWVHSLVAENSKKRLEKRNNYYESYIPKGVCLLKLPVDV